MKRRTVLLSSIIGITLFACGGGGGGGGGTSDTGAVTIHSAEYLGGDIKKTYTFTETEVDTYEGQQGTQTSTFAYSYEPDTVDTIPSQYGYKGTLTGPYYIETITINGTLNTITYISHTGSTVIVDNSSTFTINDPDHTTMTSNVPSDWTVGGKYSQSSTEDLLNSDPDQGALSAKLGSMGITSTINVLGVETVTVANITYEAVKTLENSTRTITLNGQTKTTTTSATSWYGRGTGLVRKIAHSSIVFSDGGTMTNTVTDELTGVSQ